MHYATFFWNMYFFRSGKSNEQMPNYNDTRRPNFLDNVNNLQTGDSDSYSDLDITDEENEVFSNSRWGNFLHSINNVGN